jgi:hypothetical protein
MKYAKSTLEPETRKVFEELLDKPVMDLKPDEKAFLRARLDYMTQAEMKAHVRIFLKH